MPNLQDQLTQAITELQQMLKEDGSQVELVAFEPEAPHATLKLTSVLCNCTSSELELQQEIRGFLRGKLPMLSLKIVASPARE